MDNRERKRSKRPKRKRPESKMKCKICGGDRVECNHQCKVKTSATNCCRNKACNTMELDGCAYLVCRVHTLNFLSREGQSFHGDGNFISVSMAPTQLPDPVADPVQNLGYTCCICMDHEFLLLDGIQCNHEKRHFFCFACFGHSWATMMKKTSLVEFNACPGDGDGESGTCKGVVPADEVQQRLDNENVTAWVTKTVTSDKETLLLCRYSDCSAKTIVIDRTGSMTCNECKRTWCLRCGEKGGHSGFTCEKWTEIRAGAFSEGFFFCPSCGEAELDDEDDEGELVKLVLIGKKTCSKCAHVVPCLACLDQKKTCFACRGDKEEEKEEDEEEEAVTIYEKEMNDGGFFKCPACPPQTALYCMLDDDNCNKVACDAHGDTKIYFCIKCGANLNAEMTERKETSVYDHFCGGKAKENCVRENCKHCPFKDE